MDEKERQLVRDMCDGDTARSRNAFAAFLNEEAPYLLALIRKVLLAHNFTMNNHETAEDIFQELATSLVGAAREGSLRNVRSLRAYVYNAARICTLNHLRKGARQAAIPVASETAWERAENIMIGEGLNPVETRELEQAMADCIAQLDGKQREYVTILALHCDDPLTPSGLAELVQASPESVRQRLFEARQSLERCLKGKGFSIPAIKGG
jgi:RNA polymerase sigma factor (sigma-70 family)